METYAYCGLYCQACSVYIATQDGGKMLEALAEKLNQSVEDTRCFGCRSERVSKHCAKCSFKSCADEKNTQFCSQCGEYPCNQLKEFQTKMPHRAELFESLDYIKQKGIATWVEKMKSDFSCPSCGTINSPYLLKCRKCGSLPCNPFTARNGEKVKAFLGL